ncbi:MAG TPA: ribosome-associated translation inhibitor RaiA [Candidatus Omnitrophica bacterium]|nr:ribosome-associated translation inhibitor RaiA [Candidatus Omnitrophota bacterium]
MKLIITGRHLDVRPALKKYVSGKMSKLDRYADDIIHAHIVLELEKRFAVVEANISLKKCHITVKEKNEDMYAAIDKSFDSLKKQILKYESRLKGRRRKSRSVE